MLREHRRRRAVLFSALTLLTASIAGCAPTPEPTPTPAFASDDEAFAAAEKVYRAYNEAGNARNRGEAEPDPDDFLIGVALEDAIDARNLLAKDAVSIEGEVRIVSFHGRSAKRSDPIAVIKADVCLDVTQVKLVDASGQNITPAGRDDVVAQTVSFHGTRSSLQVSREESTDAAKC